jgi:hypothetical protein
MTIKTIAAAATASFVQNENPSSSEPSAVFAARRRGKRSAGVSLSSPGKGHRIAGAFSGGGEMRFVAFSRL